MWITRISLDMYGDSFSPRELLKKLVFPHVVMSSNEATDYKFANRSETYGFGSISLVAPDRFGLQGDIVEYESWYVDVIENNHSLFQEYGVTEINLFMDVYFTDQCNFEVFSREGIEKLGRYKVAIPMSIYRLEEKEIVELLHAVGFTKGRIDKFLEENS